MRILFPVSGAESEAYFARAAGLVGAADVTAVLVAHVVDEGRRAGLEHGRERFLDRRALAPQRLSEIEAAEREGAESVVERAAAALSRTPLGGHVEIERMVLTGRTNEVLRDLAEGWGADLIVVRGRPERPGPHSIGKTARFLIDHAPSAALMVRDEGRG
jgi:nucleotide-binding universal stress UspA family protein